jgi:hypothetical protein
LPCCVPDKPLWRLPKSVRISITGFVGSKRTALIQLIQAIATYDDAMRTSTTHLICKEASGNKYDKALEWKLHIVSQEWLYHVMEYGYSGAEKQEEGCESQFSL